MFKAYLLTLYKHISYILANYPIISIVAKVPWYLAQYFPHEYTTSLLNWNVCFHKCYNVSPTNSPPVASGTAKTVLVQITIHRPFQCWCRNLRCHDWRTLDADVPGANVLFQLGEQVLQQYYQMCTCFENNWKYTCTLIPACTGTQSAFDPLYPLLTCNLAAKDKEGCLSTGSKLVRANGLEVERLNTHRSDFKQ